MKIISTARRAASSAIFLVAVHAIFTRANAQNAEAKPCPGAADTASSQLYGLWRAQFDGPAQGATLLLEKHSELAGSVQGGVSRDGDKTLAAGDVDLGHFTLEESADGKTVTASWQGELVDASCGQEIRGVWIPLRGEARRFVLRKQGGW